MLCHNPDDQAAHLGAFPHPLFAELLVPSVPLGRPHLVWWLDFRGAWYFPIGKLCWVAGNTIDHDLLICSGLAKSSMASMRALCDELPQATPQELKNHSHGHGINTAKPKCTNQYKSHQPGCYGMSFPTHGMASAATLDTQGSTGSSSLVPWVHLSSSLWLRDFIICC
jgi:hypothetical protein